MKNKEKKLISLILFFLLTFTSATVYAENKKVLVAYTDWFPYTYEENGAAKGFEIDTLKAVLKNMGIETEFAQYPWKRCLFNLEKGHADILVSFIKTPEREKFAYFPDEYISLSHTAFFTKADKNIVFEGAYEKLKDYTIGVIAGFSYGGNFDKIDYLNKDDSKNAEVVIKKVLTERVDLGAENQAVVNGWVKKMGVQDKIRFLEPPIHTEKLYVGFSKANHLKILSDDFSKSLREFKSSDAYKEILQKYGIRYEDMIEK